MSDPPTWACPACGDPHDAAISTCTACGVARPVTLPLSPPRLGFFWFAWFAATVPSVVAGFWVAVRTFPMDWVATWEDTSLASMVAGYGVAVYAWCFVGWAQFVVLHIRLRKRRWWPWVWLSTLGMLLGTLLGGILGGGEIGQMFSGAVMGGLQFLLLRKRFMAGTWWPWIAVNSAAFLAARLAAEYLTPDLVIWGRSWPREMFNAGCAYALISGIGLEVMLRRATGAAATPEPPR